MSILGSSNINHFRIRRRDRRNEGFPNPRYERPNTGNEMNERRNEKSFRSFISFRKLASFSVFFFIGFYCVPIMLLDERHFISGINAAHFVQTKPRTIQLLGGLDARVEESKIVKSEQNKKINDEISHGDQKKHRLSSRDTPFDRDDLQLSNCESLGEWQSLSYPTCNIMHEFDLSSDSSVSIGEGSYREVWVTHDMSGKPRALKTLRFQQNYDLYYFWRHLQRHNRDAIAMEQLSKSPYVVDIYVFCGNGGLYEFGDGGSLNSYRRKTGRDPLDDLRVVIEAAQGLADFHSIDGEGKPTIVHNDIKPNQFISIDGVYKLNDFNKAMFLKYDKDTGESCPNKNKVPASTGTFRSPEEYSEARLDEKVDVYALGNTIYTILTGHWPFEGVRNNVVHNKVRSGERSPLPEAIMKSDNKYTQGLIEAMKMSQRQVPSERASAREVETFLKHILQQSGENVDSSSTT